MSEIKVALQGGFPRAYVLRIVRKTLAEAPPTTAGEQLLERKQKDVEMFWRPPRDISLLKAMCEERHEKHAACQALVVCLGIQRLSSMRRGMQEQKGA